MPNCVCHVPLSQALGTNENFGRNLEQLAVNWYKIAKYAMVLFLLRFVLAVLEGFFSKDIDSPAIWGWLASFVATAAIFAHLFIHQPLRPFSHALLVVVLEQVFGLIATFLLTQAIPQLSQEYPLPLLIVDYAGLAGALIVGTLIGVGIGRKRAEGAAPLSGRST